jgi:hypothetical protein
MQITLEDVKTRQSELAKMIEQLQQTQQGSQIEIEGCTIILDPGEHYAGAVLDDHGQHKHHLVLMAPRPTDTLNWQAAMDWAQRVGGALPDRQEQALLYANCKPHLQPEWHWSSEVYKEDASSAWSCHFYYGTQYGYHKSYEGSAVAVRRIL